MYFSFRPIELRSPEMTKSIVIVSMLTGVMGCHDLSGTQSLPSGTPDPSYYNNATGALGMRQAALTNFGVLLPGYILDAGLLTDELTDLTTLTNSTGSGLANGGAVKNPLDERLLPELSYGSTQGYQSDAVYNQLQGSRAILLQAIGQLAKYDTSAKDTAILKPAVDSALRGELYALYGYTEIMLADLFCSGIPLSTLDFQKDFTYRAGASTAQVYRDAIAHLDTAVVLSKDSVRIQNLARIGLARAYLDVGQPAAAADDVAAVPDDYLYQFSEYWNTGENTGQFPNVINQASTVADHEGTNGIDYLSSRDPRATDTSLYLHNIGVSGDSIAIGFPRVYISALRGNGYAPITIANGTEARLIEAEAALRVGGSGVASWLAILNHLRATASIPWATSPADTVADTLGITGCDANHICGVDGVSGGTFQVPAGYSFAYGFVIQPVPTSNPDLEDACFFYSNYEPCYDGVYDSVRVYLKAGARAALAPLTDPGTDSARIALTFQERAFWLYMTGHRQGDLRRQLRQYPTYWNDQTKMYPIGLYTGLGAGTYGADVTAPIPQAEYINPLFTGCINRAP